MRPRLALLGWLAVLALAGPAPSAAEEPAEHHLVVGTAPVAGLYYPTGGAVCRLVNAGRARHGLRCLVEATAGAEENLRRLREGDLEFALVQSDWQYHAYRSGLGRDGEPFEDLRAVFSLQAVPFTLLAAADSGIARLEDLEGKRLNLGPPETFWRAAGDFLIESLGWDEDDFAELDELGLDEQAAGLCDGRIDATVLPISHPSALVAEAEACGARLVPVDGEAVKRLLSEWAFYAPVVIPGGLYPENPDPVPSFGLRTTLVTRADLPEETVYQVTRAVFERLEALKAQHTALAGLDAEDMVASGNTAPLHDGALRYYRERGWIATE